MLVNYIEIDAFRRGMHAYLTKHSYKNTLTEDLWSALEEASGKPVGKVMGTWTGQMGFPVVVVENTNKENGKIKMVIKLILSQLVNTSFRGSCMQRLRQEKFTADGKKPKGSFLWRIPITVVTSEGKTESYLMEEETMPLEIEAEKWAKLNNDFIGYYRYAS